MQGAPREHAAGIARQRRHLALSFTRDSWRGATHAGCGPHRRPGVPRTVPLHDGRDGRARRVVGDRGARRAAPTPEEGRRRHAPPRLSRDRPARVPAARLPARRPVRAPAHGAPRPRLLRGAPHGRSLPRRGAPATAGVPGDRGEEPPPDRLRRRPRLVRRPTQRRRSADGSLQHAARTPRGLDGRGDGVRPRRLPAACGRSRQRRHGSLGACREAGPGTPGLTGAPVADSVGTAARLSPRAGGRRRQDGAARRLRRGRGERDYGSGAQRTRRRSAARWALAPAGERPGGARPVIPRDFITEWRQTAPWIQDSQVEQDLILSRALVEIFAVPEAREALAFRGGTALYTLHLTPPARYSEDIDLVQIAAGPIGSVLDAMRARLDPWLGTPRRTLKEGRVVLLYRMQSEGPTPLPLRLKIEINSR